MKVVAVATLVFGGLVRVEEFKEVVLDTEAKKHASDAELKKPFIIIAGDDGSGQEKPVLTPESLVEEVSQTTTTCTQPGNCS